MVKLIILGLGLIFIPTIFSFAKAQVFPFDINFLKIQIFFKTQGFFKLRFFSKLRVFFSKLRGFSKLTVFF